jgi:Mitochondrial ribosomal protein (VAR1)
LDRSILAQYLSYNLKNYNIVRLRRILFKLRRVVEKEAFHSSKDHPKRTMDQLMIDQQGIQKDQGLGIVSYLTGIKVQVSGKLMTQRTIPRKTSWIFSVGSLSRPFVKDQVLSLKNEARMTGSSSASFYNYRGSTSGSGHLNLHKKVDYRQYTRKTKKGAYTVKVWLGIRNRSDI